MHTEYIHFEIATALLIIEEQIKRINESDTYMTPEKALLIGTTLQALWKINGDNISRVVSGTAAIAKHAGVQYIDAYNDKT